MSPAAGQELLRFDTHAHFHRGRSHVVDARLHDHEIAHEDRLPEIDAIDGRCHDVEPAVPEGRDRGGLVHHGEHHAAEHVTEVIRVMRHHQLGRLVLTVLDRF